MNPKSKEIQSENYLSCLKDYGAQQEINIILINAEENAFLKSKIEEIIEKRPNCEKSQISVSNACKAAAYSFSLENIKSIKLNLHRINTKEIKDFSLLKVFFESLKKSENYIIININFSYEELTLNNDIFHFFYHLNLHKIKLAEIKLFFEFKADSRKSNEMHLTDKSQQILCFQEFVDNKYFSKNFFEANLFYFCSILQCE